MRTLLWILTVSTLGAWTAAHGNDVVLAYERCIEEHEYRLDEELKKEGASQQEMAIKQAELKQTFQGMCQSVYEYCSTDSLAKACERLKDRYINRRYIKGELK